MENIFTLKCTSQLCSLSIQQTAVMDEFQILNFQQLVLSGTLQGIILTCSASTEGRVSVITLDVSAIFLFLPLLFVTTEAFSFIL